MAVYIAAIHMSGGTEHKHIASCVWVIEKTFKSGITSTGGMVEFIDNGNKVKVSDGTTTASVGVVRPQGGAPYLRAYADQKWTDNLLSLPRY